jgi:hypothetical protein
MVKDNLKSHWDHVYNKTKTEELGWYEEIPDPSVRLIKLCELNNDARILNAGSGESILIDVLIKMGFDNIIANDLSSVALNKLKTRLNSDSNKIQYIVDDLTDSVYLKNIQPVDLWHDRAALHFFNKKEEINAYFKLLKELVKSKGYVIIAAFNLEGAKKCSGLNVNCYNEAMLSENLGTDFKLIECFDHRYTMPSGDTRSYIYTLYRRR